MIDIIYETVKPSHLKKLQIMQNINNLMFQVIFAAGDNRFWKKILSGEGVISFCLGCDGKNLGASFEWGEA